MRRAASTKIYRATSTRIKLESLEIVVKKKKKPHPKPFACKVCIIWFLRCHYASEHVYLFNKPFVCRTIRQDNSEEMTILLSAWYMYLGGKKPNCKRNTPEPEGFYKTQQGLEIKQTSSSTWSIKFWKAIKIPLPSFHGIFYMVKRRTDATISS